MNKLKNSLIIALLLTTAAAAQEQAEPAQPEVQPGGETATIASEDISPADSLDETETTNDAATPYGSVDGASSTTTPTPVIPPSPEDERFLKEVGDLMGQETSPPAEESDGNENPGPAKSLIRAGIELIAALSFVIALILFVFYFIRRVGKKTSLLAGPELGAVLGRIHLARGSALHFVRAGGRILVVGVTNNAMSLIAEFDSDAFGNESEETADSGDGNAFNPDQFLDQLRSSSMAMKKDPAQPVKDDEIDSLRSDIQRLQEYLREESRDSGE